MIISLRYSITSVYYCVKNSKSYLKEWCPLQHHWRRTQDTCGRQIRRFDDSQSWWHDKQETDQTLRRFKSWWHDKHTSDLSPSPWFSLLVNSFVSSGKWVPKEASFFLSCKYSMYRMQFIQHPGYREETNLQWPKFKGLLSHPDNCSQHCWLVNHVAHDLKYQPVVGFKS